MLQRQQGPFESIMRYYTEKLDLIHGVGKAFSEQEICKYIVLGLAPDIIGRLVVTDQETNTIQGLERTLLKFETAKLLSETQAKRQQDMLQANAGALVNQISQLSIQGPVDRQNQTGKYNRPYNDSHFRREENHHSRNNGRTRDNSRNRNSSRNRTQYSGCYVCGSKNHNARACPNRFNSKNW